jgi:dipeptidyl aminopeptidase/acylaminoacyl peptidase
VRTPASFRLATSLAVATLVIAAPLDFREEAARAAFPGQNGKLAFVRALDVWVANPDGSNPAQLTSSPGLDRSPRWSPDGTRIVFASGRSGGSKLFVMNADGSDQRQITFTPARDRTSAWSADGAQVLYDKEFTEIYAVNADGGGGERKLADGLFPATSRYGGKVVFTASAVGLISMNLDGSSRFQVTRGDADWSGNWSPGGTDLVFTRPVSEGDRDVHRVHANGLGLVRLTTTPGRIEVGPVWSPDGTKIAFLGCAPPLGGSECGIYVMNRDGRDETQVPNLTASFAEANLDWQPLAPFPQDAAPATLTVALAPTGGGTVTSAPDGLACPPVCSTEFDRGASVRLEARSNGALAFLGWTGACFSRSASCVVSMDGEKRVAASFGIDSFKLSVSVRGPGRVVSSPPRIACASRCTATFSRGARVVLRARPARDARLARWNGACGGTKSCTVTMSADRVVSARFRR